VARVRESGFRGSLLLLDNGSTPSLEPLARAYGCTFIRNRRNRFVNPAWNQIFRVCGARYLTLLNNDCLVRDGYLDEAPLILSTERLALAAPSGIRVPSTLTYQGDLSAERGAARINRAARRDGQVMTIDMAAYGSCRFIIPARFRIWYGDDWIWGQLRLNGFACAVIENRSYISERSSTIRANPHLSQILAADTSSAFNSPLMTRLHILAESAGEGARSHWDRSSGPMSKLRRVLTSARDLVQLWR